MSETPYRAGDPKPDPKPEMEWYFDHCETSWWWMLVISCMWIGNGIGFAFDGLSQAVIRMVIVNVLATLIYCRFYLRRRIKNGQE